MTARERMELLRRRRMVRRRSVLFDDSGFLHTLTGSILHITDGLAKPAQSLTVEFSPIQTGSGDPSPDNIRPILGRTSLDVVRTGANLINLTIETGSNGSIAVNIPFPCTCSFKASEDFAQQSSVWRVRADLKDGTSLYGFYPWNSSNNKWASVSADNPIVSIYYRDTYIQSGTVTMMISAGASNTEPTFVPYVEPTTSSIPLPSTIYGGSDEVVGGNGSKTWCDPVDLGTLTWYKGTYGTYTAFYTDIISDKAGNYNFLCSQYKAVEKVRTQLLDNEIGVYHSSANYWKQFVIRDDAKAELTPNEFKTAMDGVQVAYELATPVPFTTIPTQIDILEGENVIWSSGDTMTLQYYGSQADDPQILGNLNVLLGGRYYNNHTANEPTDAEALNILLGGSR